MPKNGPPAVRKFGVVKGKISVPLRPAPLPLPTGQTTLLVTPNTSLGLRKLYGHDRVAPCGTAEMPEPVTLWLIFVKVKRTKDASKFVTVFHSFPETLL